MSAWNNTVNLTASSLSELSNKKCFNFDVNLSHESYLYIIHITTAVINGVFAISSTFGNALILYVIWKHSSLHNPSNTLLCCLAFSDLLVGALAQPAFVIHKIGELTPTFWLYCGTRVATESVGVATSGVSILTLGAISVERFLALKLNLRYKEVVRTSRILFIVGVFWLVMSAISLTKIFVEKLQALCDLLIFIVLVASFVVIAICYAYIFRCVVRHQKTIDSEQTITNAKPHTKDARGNRASQTFSFLRYKKSTVTMAYILGFYVLFYLPFVVALVARKRLGYTNTMKAVYICASTLVFLNSTVNPIVYCWRMSEIRNHVKQTLRNIGCLRQRDRVVEFGTTAPAPSIYLNFDILLRKRKRTFTQNSASVSEAP